MPSAFFLAQTAAEFQQELSENAQKAWMACHFSPYGTGLSNLPQELPPEGMLIVNDRTPAAGHDPGKIAEQLRELVQQFGIRHVLLDFERWGEAQNGAIAKAIVKTLPCPVGVSASYARDLDCPVFLPPLPLHMPLEAYLAPWQDRPVWLELAVQCATYRVAESGCAQIPGNHTGHFPHFDPKAYCRYHIDVQPDAICFTLRRGWEELALLRQHAAVDCCIGLYQEFAQPEAQATAFAQ